MPSYHQFNILKKNPKKVVSNLAPIINTGFPPREDALPSDQINLWSNLW